MLLLVPAVAAGLIACSNSGSQADSATKTSAAGATSAASARSTAAAASTLAKLRGALLTRVYGIRAAEPVVTGNYASLAAADPGGHVSRGVRVTPEACAAHTPNGLNAAVLAASPAAAITFKLDHSGASEMLVSSSAASRALAGPVSAQCGRFKETIDGRTFNYTVRESSVVGIGMEARALNVRLTGGSVENMWSLVYRGAGFVGSVTLVGPDASERNVRELGKQAYEFAAKMLS